MRTIQTSYIGAAQLTEKTKCDECSITLEDSPQLQIHMMNNHVSNKRNGRVLPYIQNEKRAKAKLLKGAKRMKNLDVEIKSGCVNLRFSDGSYFKVVLPILREWHNNIGKSFILNDLEIKVEESDPGIDDSNKHIDTKLVIIANTDRLVLHAYNGTQNLMVQGKNYANFAVNYLEPFFSKKVNEDLEDIEKFNSNVKEMLGQKKTALNPRTRSAKPFNCPECNVRSTTVADLKMHMKSSHSRITQKNKSKIKAVIHEDLSLIEDMENSVITLEEN